MRNRLLPFALLALALLAGGLWVVARGSGGGGRDAVRPSAAATPVEGAAAPSPDVEGAPSGLEEIEPAEGASDKPARVVASTEREDELARALWVEGRVVFPPDTPADERVKVIARGKKFKHGPAHAATVAQDGSFRVAFAEGTRGGQLDLDARYLYLDQPLWVEPGAGEPMVLAARLGGVLRGRVLPPPALTDGAQVLAGKRVELGYAENRLGVDRKPLDRSAELDRSLTFVFRALPAEASYQLTCDAGICELARADDIPIQAGKETVRDLQMQIGASVAGRVFDEAGAALADVEVAAWSGSLDWPRHGRTDAHGAFSLRGIAAGDVTLRASADGWLSLQREIGPLERGAERTGIELSLGRGLSISGKVLWPDGTPAQGARITVQSQTDALRLGDGRSTTDPAGGFTISGLEPGPYRVIAATTREEKVLQMSALFGRERERTVRTKVHAAQGGVEAGVAGLVLEIPSGESVRGSVIDSYGKPVDDFQVSAKRVEGALPELKMTLSFEDPRGTFELPGLQPGTYRLEVKAEGYLDSSSIKLEVPLAAELEPIALIRAARVSGLVAKPGGGPGAGAVIETARGKRTFDRIGVADEHGRFDIGELRSGATRLRAALEGYSPSEPLELELTPGASQEDLTLHLREGTRLTGQVLDAEGRGSPLRLVTIEKTPRAMGSYKASQKTDDSGAFVFRGLEAGAYALQVPPTEAELDALGFTDLPGARDALASKTQVEVATNGGHVLLTIGNPRAIRVFGKVSSAGKEVTATGMLEPVEGGTSLGFQSSASGEYESLVPAPGAYVFKVHVEGSRTLARFPVAVVGPGEQRVDIDVPADPSAEGALDSDEAGKVDRFR